MPLFATPTHSHECTSLCLGALTALVYALDKDTLHRLNWRTIRVSTVLPLHQATSESNSDTTVNSLLMDTLSNGQLRYKGHFSSHQLHYICSVNKGHSLYKGQNHWN